MHKALQSSLLVAIALALTGGCPNPNGSGGLTTGGTATSTDADRIVVLVNSERSSRGLAALTRNSKLDAAAIAHSDDMSANGFFSHTGSDGGSVTSRATAAGYAWIGIAENIGQGDLTPETMMDLWMDSAGHRTNILNATYTELGVGINDSGVTLWVQVFGRQ